MTGPCHPCHPISTVLFIRVIRYFIEKGGKGGKPQLKPHHLRARACHPLWQVMANLPEPLVPRSVPRHLSAHHALKIRSGRGKVWQF